MRMARPAEEELWELDELELGSPDSDASERTGKRAYESSRSSDESELGERPSKMGRGRSSNFLPHEDAELFFWGADGSDASAEAAPASANVAPRPRDASPPAANDGIDAKGCGAHRVPSRENDEEDQRLRDHTNANLLLGGSSARADSRARRIERTSERPAARMQLCTSRRV